MAELNSIKALLHSKYIDSSNVKPYTGLHINRSGDIVLTTPSLESYRVNNDPRHQYKGSMSARLPKEIDYRIISYDSLENRRYHRLRMKQPEPLSVTRIFQERFGPVVSPRVDPLRTVRIPTAPGYRLLVGQIPNQDRTMVSQRFNKLSPFVTEHGNNPFAQQSIS